MTIFLKAIAITLLLTTNVFAQKDADFYALLANPASGNNVLIVNVQTCDSAGQVAIERSFLVAHIMSSYKSLSDKGARDTIYNAMKTNSSIKIRMKWRDCAFWDINDNCKNVLIKDTTNVLTYFNKKGAMLDRLDIWPCVFRDLYNLEIAVYFDCESGYPHYLTKKALIRTVKQTEAQWKFYEQQDKAKAKKNK
jgi:hypothetical protein